MNTERKENLEWEIVLKNQSQGKQKEKQTEL
jgi:hypothetical protein